MSIVSTRTLRAVQRAAVGAVAVTATGLTVAVVDVQASDTGPATPTVGVTQPVEAPAVVPAAVPAAEPVPGPIDLDDCPGCGLG